MIDNGISANTVAAQTFKGHSVLTAKYASDILSLIGLSKTGYLCGLLHNMGGESDASNNSITITHGINSTFGKPTVSSSATVVFMLENFHKGTYQQLLTCEIIAFAIGSIHGLFDYVSIDGKWGFDDHIVNKNEELYNNSLNYFLSQCANMDEIKCLFDEATCEITDFVELKAVPSVKQNGVSLNYFFGMLSRIVLSALIDADRKATEGCYFKPSDNSEKIKMWNEQLSFCENKLFLMKSMTETGRLRYELSEECSKFADKPCGIYKLQMPSGYGKTVSSLRYALKHAALYNKRRIIFAAPIFNILSQSSKLIKSFLMNSSIVTEFYSKVLRNEYDANCEFVPQSLDESIILTDIIHLSNILFSGKMSDIRRMNILTDSVLIIDEIQQLPLKMTYMFNEALNFLSSCCNTTIILSGAAQPSFNELNSHNINLSMPHNMVKKIDYAAQSFTRFEITNKLDRSISTDELTEMAEEIITNCSSLLIIVNTKSSAAKLYELMKCRNDNVFHLSDSMCMIHRENILKELKRHINKGDRTICISTQIIEAGIDISFESVIRAKAGLDSIAKAAGRCNRNGEFEKTCSVYLVTLNDERLTSLKSICESQWSMDILDYNFSTYPKAFMNNILSEESIYAYFIALYRPADELLFPSEINGRKVFLFNLLSTTPAHASDRYSYILTNSLKTSGELYNFYEENTIEVMVPYGKAEDLIAEYASERALNNSEYIKKLITETQPYIIKIDKHQFIELDAMGFIYTICDDRIIVLHNQCYDENTGFICVSEQI